MNYSDAAVRMSAQAEGMLVDEQVTVCEHLEAPIP